LANSRAAISRGADCAAEREFKGASDRSLLRGVEGGQRFAVEHAIFGHSCHDSRQGLGVFQLGEEVIDIRTDIFLLILQERREHAGGVIIDVEGHTLDGQAAHLRMLIGQPAFEGLGNFFLAARRRVVDQVLGRLEAHARVGVGEVAQIPIDRIDSLAGAFEDQHHFAGIGDSGDWRGVDGLRVLTTWAGCSSEWVSWVKRIGLDGGRSSQRRRLRPQWPRRARAELHAFGEQAGAIQPNARPAKPM
jgi:hypothetical protein